MKPRQIFCVAISTLFLGGFGGKLAAQPTAKSDSVVITKANSDRQVLFVPPHLSDYDYRNLVFRTIPEYQNKINHCEEKIKILADSLSHVLNINQRMLARQDSLAETLRNLEIGVNRKDAELRLSKSMLYISAPSAILAILIAIRR
jgi:hypothetical protein